VVDEEVLKREFGQFGAVASVKIMWPRDEEQRRRGRNCGFVAFMTRDGAQAAKDNLNGKLIHEFEMHVGWGKAVPLPALPVYPPPDGVAAGRLLPPGVAPPAPLGGGFSAVPPVGSGFSAVPAPLEMMERPTDPAHVGSGPDIAVPVPEPRERFIIDTMADYVSVDGTDFEQAVMEREKGNPEFGFLYDLDSTAHVYYRWRLYSLLQGDTLRSWRIAPFVMVAGSPRWVPPPMTSESAAASRTAAQGGSGRASKERGRPLSDTQRDRFEDMLRGLTAERDSICNAMAFCLDNAESAHEITEILTEAMTIPETPANLKVARLFLLSDILHNSTAPVKNASNFRTRLHDSIPAIFDSLADCYRACDSRMTQETLRRHVLRVLRVWRNWFIFSDDYLNGLQATFLYIGSAAAKEAARNEDLEMELLALSDAEVERRCRHAGLNTSRGRSTWIERLLALDSYLKGDGVGSKAAGGDDAGDVSAVGGNTESASRWLEPSSESTPGATRAAIARRPAVRPKPTRTKWALDDDGGGEDEKEGGGIFSDDDDDERPDASAVSAVASVDEDDEERRLHLRQVEVEMVELRERLDKEGVSSVLVEARVAARRAQLIAEFDEARKGNNKKPAVPVTAPSPSPAPVVRSEGGRAREPEAAPKDTPRRTSEQDRESRRRETSGHRDRESERERSTSNRESRRSSGRRSSRSPSRQRRRSSKSKSPARRRSTKSKSPSRRRSSRSRSPNRRRAPSSSTRRPASPPSRRHR